MASRGSLMLSLFVCIVASSEAKAKVCKNIYSCHGVSCDDWVAENDGHTCSSLESLSHCDCTGCACANEPSTSSTCTNQDGCFGHSCRYWSDEHKLSCATLEIFYHCDCSGCGCKTPFETYKVADIGKWKKIQNHDCVSMKLSGNLRIGEGYGKIGKQTFDRWTVDECKQKCAKHPDCKGFNYDGEAKICRYKRADTSHKLSTYEKDHDCYLFERTPTTPAVTLTAGTTVVTTTTTQRLRTGRPLLDCASIVCGGKSHCIDHSPGFECFCAEGWIGGGINTVCQDVNECVGVKCGGKSVCFNGLNMYTCLCGEGWRGGGDNTVCTANVCTCEHGKAATAAQCPSDGKNKCMSCDHGYDLTMKDTCEDTCASKSCSGHGKCYAGKCYCDAHYTGSNCEVSPDPCATVRCGRHGRCFDATCFCEDFYTGDNCEIPPGLGQGHNGVVVVHGRE